TEKVRIAEALQAIETSAQQREREMFSIDRVPIWKMEASEEPLRSRVSRELRSRLDSVSEYVKTNRNAVIGATALFLLIVGLAVYARPAIVRLGEEGGIYDVERTFIERPVSLALLLGAALIPRFLLPPMPLGLGVIRLLVIVAALLSVVSVISSRKEAGTLAGLLLLTALSGVLEVVQQTDASDRIVLMLVAGLAAYFFASLRRQLRDQPRPDKTLWWRIGYFITAIAPPFLIVCIIAVILGAVAFAQQNVDGTLYLFTLILVIVFVEESLSAAARIFINGPGQNWLRSIRRFPELAHQRLTFLTRLVMLYIFLTALPQLFPQLKVFYDQLIAALTFEVSMGTLNLSVGEVLGLVVGLVLAVLVAKFIRFTLDEDVFPRLPIATGKAAAASRLIYYTLVAGGILFALAAGGIELTKLTLIISALGVGIGFGLQGIVNNFVSGLVLAFERPFQMGDIIATGTLTGRVREIGLRASRIRTFDGAEVIVPNADLIAGNVINWTLSDRTRRLDIRIGVAYGTDPKRVKEILLGVAEDSEVVAKDPEPAALFEGFGDSSLNFTLRAWIPEAGDWPSLSSDLYVAVHDAIVDAGIEIPFPQRTLHIRKGDI
ncbi:MAG: mechanosensitive ion channel, partial [Gammaproteobacteria bacterium]|nr:mechanosensitive ion channel [Gammaproteobacteria bacterium]